MAALDRAPKFPNQGSDPRPPPELEGWSLNHWTAGEVPQLLKTLAYCVLIYFKLINQEMNTALLKDVPWRAYLDLAIVYYVSVSAEDCTATVLVHSEHIASWGLTEKDLYEVAYENTLAKRKASILKMRDIIKDMVIERITGSTDILAEDVDYGGKSKDEIEDMVEEEIDRIL